MVKKIVRDQQEKLLEERTYFDELVTDEDGFQVRVLFDEKVARRISQHFLMVMARRGVKNEDEITDIDIDVISILDREIAKYQNQQKATINKSWRQPTTKHRQHNWWKRSGIDLRIVENAKREVANWHVPHRNLALTQVILYEILRDGLFYIQKGELYAHHELEIPEEYWSELTKPEVDEIEAMVNGYAESDFRFNYNRDDIQEQLLAHVITYLDEHPQFGEKMPAYIQKATAAITVKARREDFTDAVFLNGFLDELLSDDLGESNNPLNRQNSERRIRFSSDKVGSKRDRSTPTGDQSTTTTTPDNGISNGEE